MNDSKDLSKCTKAELIQMVMDGTYTQAEAIEMVTNGTLDTSTWTQTAADSKIDDTAKKPEVPHYLDKPRRLTKEEIRIGSMTSEEFAATLSPADRKRYLQRLEAGPLKRLPDEFRR